MAIHLHRKQQRERRAAIPELAATYPPAEVIGSWRQDVFEVLRVDAAI
ncbi:MAG: hypothetical protein F6K42_20795 [Leptolyngbya sp. SIO1D8]|nr:hypothetical protein [Leptolyngbya sp. SIO1D8]